MSVVDNFLELLGIDRFAGNASGGNFELRDPGDAVEQNLPEAVVAEILVQMQAREPWTRYCRYGTVPFL